MRVIFSILPIMVVCFFAIYILKIDSRKIIEISDILFLGSNKTNCNICKYIIKSERESVTKKYTI